MCLKEQQTEMHFKEANKSFLLIKYYTRPPPATIYMHSSRIRTARSLTVSHHILHTPPQQPRMPPDMHAPHPATMHAPWQPCIPGNHAHPLATMHAPWQPCTPQQPHAPSNHAHPPATTHAPLSTMHAPPPSTMHAPSPIVDGQTPVKT